MTQRGARPTHARTPTWGAAGSSASLPPFLSSLLFCLISEAAASGRLPQLDAFYRGGGEEDGSMDDWIEERGLVCLVNSQDFTAGMIQDTFGPKSFDINLIEIFLIILYKLIYDMPHRR